MFAFQVGRAPPPKPVKPVKSSSSNPRISNEYRVGRQSAESRSSRTGTTDYQVLTELFNSSFGEKWSAKSNWCSKKPLNEWFGIEINENVTKIDLSKNNLTGKMKIVTSFHHQEYIVRHLQHQGSLLASIGGLIDLQHLDLSGNNLTGNQYFSTIPSSRKCCLWTGEIPLEIGNLNFLTVLNLEKNEFSGSCRSIGNVSVPI